MKQLEGHRSIQDQTIDLDVKAVRKSGIVADGSLTSWLYVHWDTLKDFFRRITGINNIIRVKAVFTSNITISASGSTVDGYTLLNGDVVLVAGQTDTTQNGLYTWATGGALTRLAPFTATFASGLAILNIALQGRMFHVLNGNVNRNTFWYFDSPTQFPVIGTSSLLFYNVANLKVSTAANNLIVSGTDGVEVKLKNTGQVGGQDVFGGLQYDATTKEFYIITSLMPGANGSLIVEEDTTQIGVASRMRFKGTDFDVSWDNPNSRATVNINRDALASGAIGTYWTNFDGGTAEIDASGTGHTYFYRDIANGAATPSFGSETDTTRRSLSFMQVSVNPNIANSGLGGVAGRGLVWANANFIHNFSAYFSAPTLNTNIITLVAGFVSGVGFGNPPSHGIYFRANTGVNSGNIQCVCRASNVETVINTAISPTGANNVAINFNATTVLFYINGTLVATINTNVPNTSAQAMFVAVGLVKNTSTVANANNIMRINQVYHAYTFIP